MLKRFTAAMLVASVAISAAGLGPASAEDPTAIPWTEWMPPMHESTYEPTAADDCRAGRIQCVDKVINEMTKRFNPLAAACAHNAMFSLMYLRTTEQYRASATTEGFFRDPTFINHQDVVFARYYFEAWDAHYEPNPSSPEPADAWRIAFEAADAKRVSSSGNMFLGMSAHVNRDLPMALAEIGLVRPDGSSRKDDHDKVNQFLVQVIEPLFAEAARRFDPTVDDSSIAGTTLDETATVSLLQSWREQAWRNAERIVGATTEAERAAVLADIERTAVIEAQLIIAATAYNSADANNALDIASTLGASPSQLLAATVSRTTNLTNGVLGGLFTNKRAQRDAYCAAHWDD